MHVLRKVCSTFLLENLHKKCLYVDICYTKRRYYVIIDHFKDRYEY